MPAGVRERSTWGAVETCSIFPILMMTQILMLGLGAQQTQDEGLHLYCQYTLYSTVSVF